MIKAGKTIKNSNVLVLGVTFKENCPDIRSSKVIDIINELKDYGINVDVYDPWVSLKTQKEGHINEFISNPLVNKKKYEAILVAVGHKQFKEYTAKIYSQLSYGQEVIIDIKNIVDNPTWRL